MSRSLTEIADLMKRLAPLEWAEPWDNVGLLIEPPERPITKVLLTIDLTEEVFAEARAVNANLIVAYHPPIFAGLKRLTQATAGERIVIEAVRNEIAIYSPHTALDAAVAGLNDWLAKAIGHGERQPIIPVPNAPPGVGMGRLISLATPTTLHELLTNIKRHLGLSRLRVAATTEHAQGKPILSAAVCAGAGGSVFEKCGKVDVLLTGEMRHHDVLARVASGATVILTDHTHTERGYLQHLADTMRQSIGVDVEVVVSAKDKDPLEIQ